MKNKYIILMLLFGGMLALVNCTGNSDSSKSHNEISKDSLAAKGLDYLEIGKKMAISTKSNLAKHLIHAITERGTAGAVEFCNIKAIPITDSMSLVVGAKIKRVSDKPRNPNNKANSAELAYINKWKAAEDSTSAKAPLVTEVDGKILGYYPIISNQMCMQCHGKPELEIKTATLKKIKKLYPNDEAVGYKENDIRGIFVVEMNKK